jgi:hypothetical protein
MFRMISSMSLSEVPGSAAVMIGAFAEATDDPDDPARFIVDHAIAAMPDGVTKTVAHELAPYVAAYLNTKLAQLAPRFAGSVAAIVDGTGKIARDFGTIERVRIEHDAMTRTIVGYRFDRDVVFADHGLSDVTVGTRVALGAAGELTIADHAVGLDYATLLRLGLDESVIPSVDPAARDLDHALQDLIDCPRVGAVIADLIGVGTPSMYATACAAGMTIAATEIYRKLAAVDSVLVEVAGTGRGFDDDGDGTMDRMTGTWVGPGIGPSSFAGDDQAR